MDVDAILQQQETQSSFGTFEEPLALIYGVFEFDYADGTKTNRKSFKFSSYLSLEAPLMSAFAPPSHKYSIRLEANRSNYRVSKPLSQVLKPGEADRFNITILSEKSSSHNFEIKVRYNGNQWLQSVPVAMNMFVPRSSANSQLENET